MALLLVHKLGEGPDRLTVYYEDQLNAKVINRVRFSLNPIVK
jgi:hypothetical protein